MSGYVLLNRMVTFLEVNFSGVWNRNTTPDPWDGFFGWIAPEDGSGSISITRSDGKVLHFTVPNNGGVVETRENVIRWTASDDIWPGSDGPFQ